MQYFDVKINSGNIFSHGPMISILTDWTLILAKCCRGNESWERILFLLRLKKKWRRKKKEWSSTVPEERESRRSKLIGRQPRRQELQQQLGIRGKHVFVELLISLLVAIHLHRSMRASVRSSSSKKKLHMKQIYTSATRHLLPHKKRGTRCADARASFSRKPTGNRTRRKSESADPDQMLTQSLRLDRIQLHFMENPC